jgi:hypothetical protein
MLSKTHKYKDEDWGLKEEWEEEFIFLERNGKPGHLVCENALSQFYNIVCVAENFMLVPF